MVGACSLKLLFGNQSSRCVGYQKIFSYKCFTIVVPVNKYSILETIRERERERERERDHAAFSRLNIYIICQPQSVFFPPVKDYPQFLTKRKITLKHKKLRKIKI